MFSSRPVKFSQFTESTAVALTPFMLAVIVAVPLLTELASPLAVMVATFTLDDVQVIWLVRYCVVPSLKLPTALNRVDPPRAMLALLGVMVIEVRVALVTVNDAVPTCPANTAVMVAVPGAIPFANPLVPPESLMVATDAGDEVHNTELVRFWVLPSANVPTALNCTPVCSATLAFAGVTWTDVSCDESTTREAPPLTEPCCAVTVAVPAD